MQVVQPGVKVMLVWKMISELNLFIELLSIVYDEQLLILHPL